MTDEDDLIESVARAFCRDYHEMMGYLPNEILLVESKAWRDWIPDARMVLTHILKTHDLVKRENHEGE